MMDFPIFRIPVDSNGSSNNAIRPDIAFSKTLIGIFALVQAFISAVSILNSSQGSDRDANVTLAIQQTYEKSHNIFIQDYS